jgi:tetratricopeptide (TPR) repeat protein
MRAAVIVALVVTGGSAGAGEPRDEQATARAKQYNAEAEKLFNLGMFREAAAAYQRAYAARPLPVFLYNIGQCHRRMGGLKQLERALFHYEAFINNTDDAAARERVRQESEELRREIARLRAAERPARPFYTRWWFWTAVGVAVAGATVGTVLALQPDDQQPVEGNLSPAQIPLP